MGVSDVIADFIDELISETGGIAELQRADLASKFNCVPSQINYVISTRFSTEHGYIVESRRGGGGYIRIKRVTVEAKLLLMHAINSVGDCIDSNTASAIIANLRQNNAINDEEAKMIIAAISTRALMPAKHTEKDFLRASILKQLLIYSIK